MGTYTVGHKKVNVSYSFYYRSLVRSIFTIKNRFYDCDRFKKTIETVNAIFAHAHFNKKSHERQIWASLLTTTLSNTRLAAFLQLTKHVLVPMAFLKGLLSKYVS